MFRKKNVQEPRRVRQPASQSGSPVIFSYHANRSGRSDVPRDSTPAWVSNTSKKPAAVRPSQHHWPRRILKGALILLAVLFVANSLLVDRTLEIIALADTQGRQVFLRKHEVYREAAEVLMAHSLTNTNKVTIDTARLAKEMQKQFPELEQVSVALPIIGRRAAMYIQPARPVLLLKTGNEVYVLDESGRALMPAREVPGIERLKLHVIEDQSGLPVKIGQRALPATYIAFITEVIEQLKAKGVTITALTLPPGTSELDARIKDAPYVVKFNLRANARVEAGTFLAVKQHLEREKKVPAQYIDVRVDNRAYYR